MSDNKLPADAQRLCRKLARRVNAGVLLTRAAVPAASVIICFGLAMLFAQMLAPQFAGYTYGILALVPVAIVWAWYVSRRDGAFFSDSDVIELADKLSKADGLAATAWERPGVTDSGGATWSEIRQNLDFTPLRPAPAYFAWRLVPAFAFAGLVFMVPPRNPPGASDIKIMEGLAQPLQEKLSMSAEILPKEEQAKLQEQLDKLQEAEDGMTREKWEAIEAVQQKLEHALSQTDAAARQLTNSLEEMSNLVSQKTNASSPQEAAAAQNEMDALADAIEKMAANNNFQLSPELKEKLKTAMSQCKGGNCSAADLDKLRKNAQALCDSAGKKLGKKASPGNAGSGGVERGRADAALNFGVERNVDGAKFTPDQLENQYMDEASLVDIGLTIIEPKADPGVFKEGTVKQFASPTGSNVSRTEISPAQRGVVSRYFK